MYPKTTLSPRAREELLPNAAGGAADANVAAPAMTMASVAARSLIASCDTGNPRFEAICSSFSLKLFSPIVAATKPIAKLAVCYLTAKGQCQ
jgi:hypothetical protein